MLENFKKWPYFDDADIQTVSDILRSGKVNRWTGSKNIEFEAEICRSVQCKYAIALANGSLALELALVAADVKEGDEVITTCRTFMASASSAVMRGAIPVVADVDLDSQNITAETIEKCITPKTKAIIAVHHAGWPCDMDAIMALAKKYNLFVIEDCAQAHGAVYKGRPVGSIGDVAAWSYCQDKIITTGGEGGAVTTNREEYWNYYTTIQYGTSENIQEFFKRVYDFLDELKTKNYESVLIVAHSGVSKAFNGYFEGIQDGKFLNRGLKNCEVKEYEL